jgi:hypothetical protein
MCALPGVGEALLARLHTPSAEAAGMIAYAGAVDLVRNFDCGLRIHKHQDGQGRFQSPRTYRRLPHDDLQSAVGDYCEPALLGAITSQIGYLPVHLI